MGICNVSLGKYQNEMSQHLWSIFPPSSSKMKFQQKIIIHPNTDRPCSQWEWPIPAPAAGVR